MGIGFTIDRFSDSNCFFVEPDVAFGSEADLGCPCRAGPFCARSGHQSRSTATPFWSNRVRLLQYRREMLEEGAAVVVRTCFTFIVLLIAFAFPVSAGPFEDGVAAAETGDYVTALKIYRTLAEQGHAPSQYNLGSLYFYGQGVPQDYAEAVKWFRLAAEQGFAAAQNNLAAMYANGLGVQQDRVQAYLWWNIALAFGHEDARTYLDDISLSMTADQIEEALTKMDEFTEEWLSKQQKQ